MALETIDSAPNIESFTPLSAHEEQTPGTFFGGQPVLHLHNCGAKIKISQSDLESQAALRGLIDEDVSLNGSEQAVIEDIDLWVSSRSDILEYNPSTRTITDLFP